ncbi:MAG: hypothetical protein M1823_001132 [Watsoniomyces obsoletus]|nr:MAG: hypothetical protein M1823_001132 [Watsoniomyces obsoletus]
MSMITATVWVPRGAPAQFPTRYEFNEDEYDRISKLAKLQLDDAKEELDEARSADRKSRNGETKMEVDGDDDDLKEYQLDKYDDESEEDEGVPMSMFGNVKALAYHESNDDDPYITLPKDEGSDDEREELQILATDNLLLAAKVEDEVAHLEVYVYEDEADNLYVHHDIMLPAIPLCVEWLDVAVGKEGSDARANFVAVGTFDPDIEIWDLDIVDGMYPNAILGQGDTTTNEGSKLGKKRKKSNKTNEEYHVDAILSLAANRTHRNLLASSSADQTVKLWDLNSKKCAKSYGHHTDKVCSIEWHPTTTTVLLSGSYDRTVVAADMRAPGAKVPRWGVESDVEIVRWDPHDPNFFYITTEKGVLHRHDIRLAPSSPEASKPIWRLQAHEDALSAFDVNPHIPGFIATGSSDKEVKLWNIAPDGPTMVVSRNLDVGKVFSTTFGPDGAVSFRLAVAGSKGVVQVWDTSTNAAVRRAFADRMGTAVDYQDVKERLVGVEDDDSSESESGDEPEEGGGERQEGDGWESMEEE